jgi:hypothetical protein
MATLLSYNQQNHTVLDVDSLPDTQAFEGYLLADTPSGVYLIIRNQTKLLRVSKHGIQQIRDLPSVVTFNPADLKVRKHNRPLLNHFRLDSECYAHKVRILCHTDGASSEVL